MDKGAVLKTINRFKAIIENKKIKLSKIILFGSFANGTYKKGSDIDIILISEDFSSMDYWQRIELLTEAIYEIFEPIEAFLFTPKEWEKSDSFIVDYAKNGEIVYAA